jgi:RNA polymerase sigma-70 factor (ECF subfamily)
VLGSEFDRVIDAARDGARWALAALYEDLQPSVLAYMQARNRAEAEDLASEVWVSVAAGLARFQGDESGFRGWVFTIARRRLVDARRRTARRPSEPVPHETLARVTGTSDPEGDVLGRAEYEEVLAYLAALPKDQQDVVLLRVVAGLTVEEVGVALGKRAGTVRVLQYRALRRLAGILGEPRVQERVQEQVGDGA